MKYTDVPNYPMLQFWTLTIWLKLGEVDVFRANARLIGRDGKLCGRVHLDGFEETTFFDGDGPFMFIRLCTHEVSMQGLFGEASNEIVDSYMAMMVERLGSIVEKNGLGGILRDAVTRSFNPGPAWEEIILS